MVVLTLPFRHRENIGDNLAKFAPWSYLIRGVCKPLNQSGKSHGGDVVKLMGGFNIAHMYPSIKVLERITGIRSKLERVHNQIDEILENILREHKVKRAESRLGNAEVKEDLVDFF
ncbi:hypothetical protein ACH5RR_029063 [Cinchona calisaya]|uniref:Uncharacterized protein n=1 Tax=Cinchona calisaya TaxID=153742 RepID=A0ABD2YTU9_9GENT